MHATESAEMRRLREELAALHDRFLEQGRQFTETAAQIEARLLEIERLKNHHAGAPPRTAGASHN